MLAEYVAGEFVPDDEAVEEGDGTEGDGADDAEGNGSGRIIIKSEPESDDEEGDEADAAKGDSAGRLIKSELETEMPAQSFSGELPATAGADAVTVLVEAPEGALPEGTTMAVKRVADVGVIEAVKEKAADEAQIPEQNAKAMAVDITFLNSKGDEV